MNSQIYHTLKKFGLSENEIKIYLQTLKQDDLSPYQLSKLTGIPRTTVYDVLMGLSLKGLVELEQSEGLEKQQTKVHGKNPSILRKILKKKRDESFLLEAQIAQILPELKGDFLKNASDSDFKYYPGIKGAKKVYFEFDKYDLDIPTYYWSYLMPLDVFGSEALNRDVIADTKISKKYNYQSKFLIPLNDWTKHVMTYQTQLDSDYLISRDFRYIESPFFEFALELGIQGDYIRMVCTEGKEIWGITIRSHTLAKGLISIYNFMWNQAIPITIDAIKGWGQNKFLAAQTKIDKNFLKKIRAAK